MPTMPAHVRRSIAAHARLAAQLGRDATDHRYTQRERQGARRLRAHALSYAHALAAEHGAT